jgi:hypothetical protein
MLEDSIRWPRRKPAMSATNYGHVYACSLKLRPTWKGNSDTECFVGWIGTCGLEKGDQLEGGMAKGRARCIKDTLSTDQEDNNTPSLTSSSSKVSHRKQ